MLSRYRYLVVWFNLLLVANYPSVPSAHVFQGFRENNGGFWYLRSQTNNGGSQCHRRINVDKLGHGNFRTVQSAIDSVPPNNNLWVCITVNVGVYREKINIPYDKPYIYLKGSGSRKTLVVWGDHSNTFQSPTFTSMANNTKVKSISFVNSYNYPRNNNPRVPAVAALITGDKASFYRCRFAGVQDTLWDQSGRHYFKHCVIEGAVDFIFGAGKSLYEGCVIKVLDDGFITAQSRDNPRDAGGFVFRSCSVVGSGSGSTSTYLGRPWREYSRVLFYKSNFSSVVNPRGWNAWNFVGREKHITFAEYGNYGPGADTSHRVPWEKKLSSDDLWHLTSLSFVDTENWVGRQPFDD